MPNLGHMTNVGTNSFGNIHNNITLPYGNSSSGQTYVESSKSFVTEPKPIDQGSALSPEFEHMQKVLINLIEKCRETDKSRVGLFIFYYC